MSVVGEKSVTPHASAHTADGPVRWYAMAGLPVQSELPLPLPLVPFPLPTAPRCVIRLGDPRTYMERPGELGPEGGWQGDQAPEQPGSVVYRGPDGVWWWCDGVGAFHISTDARLIDVYPDAGAEEQLIGLMLTGPVAALVLPHFGYPTLHASAVVTSAGAVAFLGAKQQGKSTLASVFLQRGATLVTDDLLLLELRDGALYAMPGPPYLKVWAPTAERVLRLNPATLLSLSEAIPKKLVRVNGIHKLAQQSERLSAVYVLDRRDPGEGTDRGVVSYPLGRQEALAAVLAHVSQGPLLSPFQMGGLLPAFAQLALQTPVRVLSYPSGFDRQDAVYDHIISEVEEL